MEKEEEYKKIFIDIMSKIKIGCSFIYERRDSIHMSQIKDIIPCKYKDQLPHEGCKYCIGKISYDNVYAACFKYPVSWRTPIKRVINFFIEENEFMI